MDNKFRVVAVDSIFDIVKHFYRTPNYEVQLNSEVANKIGFNDGDFVEIKGKRSTVARVVPTDNAVLDVNSIGLTNLIRNNARVTPEETVIVRKVELEPAHKIVLAPIDKHLKKSELLKIIAKKSFLNRAFVVGDVTYLRSKIMRYLVGSVTWLRVIKTDPKGIVAVTNDTEFDIVHDPIDVGEHELYYLPDPSSDDGSWEKDISLNDEEWGKIHSLLELGLFEDLSEVISFFLREGIKAKSEIFDKSILVVEQIKELKANVKGF